ncbi:formate/nitrite transporter family protein [Gorillibacterium massiliense]|uniref:formate/nitrite transporter family protein n=1 Tax=Gorillibacterium massiliense TaxID=1280390 RepID=UPI0004BC92EC|nr:formate/nitrite transporter family protein [Gorillibacterium massiliense]
MYKESNEHIIEYALEKKKMLDGSLPRYLVASALAGVYVGIAVILMFSVSGPLYAAQSPFTTWMMGTSFGIALTLVVFAGAELFTGNNMAFAISTYSGATTWKDTFRNWFWCWVGNFLGAALFAVLIWRSGIMAGGALEQMMHIAHKKMHLPFEQLFFRGILCNWLVCLAIWTAKRTKSDAAKLILIFWCLFAFISSGFEHSIANMTTLTLSLLLPHASDITVGGLVHNLIPVTLGNIVGGFLFVGTAYWVISPIRSYKAGKETEAVKTSSGEKKAAARG